MFLSCHVRISKWIYTLYSTDCQGAPCSKQVQSLKFKWLQLELNPQSLSSETNTQPFGQTGQMIELCCEHLSVQRIGLYLPVMSRTHSQWVYTLYLPECQGTPWSKQVRYLKFKWLQLDSNPQPLCSERNTHPLGQTVQMNELCCEYLSVPCIWLYVLVLSCNNFTVNPHPRFAWISKNSLLETGAISEI